MDNPQDTANFEAMTPDQNGADQKGQAIAPAADRLLSLDFIRGIAVMGILWANIVAFGQPWAAYMYPDAFMVPHGEVSDWMWVVQFVLIDGKMRGLFTLLFGAGLMLFMEKAWARGASRWLQARRLFWLLMFGLIHFYFIWRGDILVLYSIAGFAAMACLRWKAKTQLVVGLLGYLVGAIMFLGAMFFPYLVAETDLGNQAPYVEMREDLASQQATDLEEGVSETAIIGSGNYADYVRHNFTEHGTDPFTMLLIFSLETFPLMLIGMALYRMGMFSGAMDARKVRLWGWAGLIVGSALTLPIALWAMGEGFTYWGRIHGIVPAAAVARGPWSSRAAFPVWRACQRLAGRTRDRDRADGIFQLPWHVDRDAAGVSRLGRGAVRRIGAAPAVWCGGGHMGADAAVVETLAGAVPLWPAGMAVALPDLLEIVPDQTVS